MGHFFTSINNGMVATRFHAKSFCYSDGSLVFRTDATIYSR